MIRAPGAKGNGRRCESPVEFVDVYPTLSDIAGLPAPTAPAGTSLRPLLADPAGRVKDATFSQFPR
jgi:arylsulfatase A-like enzyme